MHMRVMAWWMLAAVGCLTAGMSLAQTPRILDTARQQPASITGVVAGKLAESQAQLLEDGNLAAAERRAAELFDQLVAYGSPRDVAVFVDVAHELRLLRHLQRARLSEPMTTYRLLREYPDLSRALVFAVKKENRLGEVFALLHRLVEHDAAAVRRLPNLAAAICVVHDRPFTRRVNENTARAADPVAIFTYYHRHERSMLLGLRDMPVELLVWVVDTSASIEEMEWALSNYRGDQNVGRRFFDIKYDYDHFRRGAPKKVTSEGFNLPNIHRFGGVCADQAYFAMSVGKAIGVPTAYAVGRGRNVGHAWVGFFQARGSHAAWNFDVGRYADYRYIRGDVIEPQTRRTMADGEVGVLAELVGTRPQDRYGSAAMTDAASRLVEVAANAVAWPPDAMIEAGPGVRLPRARGHEVDDQLTLLEAGLRLSPGYVPGWHLLAELAEAGSLTLTHKRRWAGILQSLCGPKYPDFTLAVLRPMIQTVEDVRAQNELWNNAFKLFDRRKDLAAEVRMLQAEMWEGAGDVMQAGRCYEEVIARFANDGPFVIAALNRTEQLLRANNMQDKVVTLYEQTWARIQQPRTDAAGIFLSSSTWYQVGTTYVARLREFGDERRAQQVQSRLNSVVGQPR